MTPATTLGGPGPGCSIGRLRRLAAGELSGGERARLEEHLAGCARCQASWREVEEERRAVLVELPFERFAAGVAEKLAGVAPPQAAPAAEVAALPIRPVEARAARFLPLALAAGVALAFAAPLVLRLAPGGPDEATRLKGAASLTVYVDAGGSPRVLAPGERVPGAARLRVALPATARSHAAVGLLDGDGFALLYAGPARAGVLPEAFEWTGSGDGTLVAVLDDAPVDAAALAARLASGGAAAAASGPRAEVLVRVLRRGVPR